MTAEQAQQLMDQMWAAQAQHTAMMEEVDFSHQREQAATQAAAVERRAREVAEATARSGPPGLDTKLLGKPNEFHSEDEKWFEWAKVFRGYAGAAVPFMDELVNLVEADRQSRHSKMLLTPDLAAASRQLYWMLLMICKSSD